MKFKVYCAGIALILGFLGWAGFPYWTHNTKTIMVSKTYVKSYDGADTYIVVDSEGNVYKNVDSWYFLKFNSTDVYNQLVVGKTVTVTITGWRIPFYSEYPNIISVR